MRSMSRRGGRIVVVVLAWTLALVAPVPILAHDAECDAALRDVGLEDLEPAPGWAWRDLDVGPDGWRGFAEWVGGDIRGATLALECAADAEGLMERRAEVRERIGTVGLVLDETVGDGAAAWTSRTDGAIRLEWRSGDVFGVLRGEWNASLFELERIAHRIDAVLG